MLTPRRLLQLTHAVQQPFATHPDLPGNPTVPDSRGLKAHRQAGETFVTLTGPIAVHARTTGRLEVLARWREAIDDPADPSPRYEDRHTSACAFDNSPDEDNALVTNAYLSILSDPDIAEYKRCVRCQSLVAKIGKHSPCPASPQKASLQPEPDKSSGHLLIDNAVYALRPVQAQASTPAWRTCLACSCLFSDTGSAWPCSASENHVPPPLSSISLVPAAPTTTGEGGWHRCKNCGVAFNVGAKPWACPGAGPHEPDGPPFVLPRIDRVSKHEFGDTKHRMVVYHSVATTRFREFFPEEIQTDLKNLQQEEPHEGRDEPALTHIVPSCARPAAPDVEYIVPTFRWEDHSTAGVMARTRIGRGVRIYLRRPWFSSGDGELLGVLLRQPVGRLSLPMPDERPVVEALAS
jgi:hypothetical protein